MSSVFQIKEHILECQHIREYAQATSISQEDVLHMAIKQYIPLDNLQPQDGDVTIIGAHANGFPKVNTLKLHEARYLKFIGALRALMGGPTRTVKKCWLQNTEYLDNGCRPSRMERSVE
jgi:hypothetical protein